MNNIRKNNSTLILFIVIIFTIFSFGFIIGSGLMYSQYSEKLSDLEDTLNEIEGITNPTNITYYYNETSLSNIYNNVKDSIVEITGIISSQSFFGIQSSKVQGSGFVYNHKNNYYVITNFHVVDDPQDISVTFENGNSYPAEVIGSDPYSDLAVLTIHAPAYEFKTIEIVKREY